jgi:hypothetical protein
MKIKINILLTLCFGISICYVPNLKAQSPSFIQYNGIVLPEVWPPRYVEPNAACEMPVPYLQHKPDVIPVNVGRQLFVDDFLVAESNMSTDFHTPRFYRGNPVLAPDKEWEKTAEGGPYAAPFSDGVWYDDEAGIFKMWYLAGSGMLHKDTKQSFYTGYAESKDGRHWVKPILDILSGTNIVDTCSRDASTIWLDRTAKDASKRFKMFNVERRFTDGRWQFVLKYSSDGIHWSNGAAQSGDMYDRSSVFYNPFRKVWCLSMRYGTVVSSRSRSYLENSDPEMAVSLAHRTRKGVSDKNIVFWFTPDDKEPRHPQYPNVNPGIYNFDCIAYESIILGQYSVWRGPENNVCEKLGIQKKNEVFLGYSRDGFHFSRPSHQPFMANDESEGAWNWGNMQSVAGTPLIVGDSLYFYSSGRRLNKIMWDSYASTGLAVLRRDGFVSRGAPKAERYLLTEKLTFDGKYLFVNANIRGYLKIELLDGANHKLAVFGNKDFRIVKKADSTKLLVGDISSIQGKVVRLRFTMSQGDLYSFWISPWETGESRGYTAGGGPGLSASGIDEPIQ